MKVAFAPLADLAQVVLPDQGKALRVWLGLGLGSYLALGGLT